MSQMRPTLSAAQQDSYQRDGYLIVRGLFTKEETAELQQFFMDLSEKEPIWPYWRPDRASTDPLKHFPRVIFPHRYHELPRRFLLDPRLLPILRGILADEPIACQSMFYYKPPGARGQAFHQDNFYLAVQPQSCLAAWIATEQVDEENGCLYLCPGTHELDLQCPELAEEEQSFTTHIVRPPAGTTPVPAVLAPGDTLFFNGSVVHGSQPNRSARWRRSFIGHYMPASSRAIGKSFQPGVDFDGRDVRFKASGGTEACGEEFAPSAFWEDYKQGKPSSAVPSA